MSVCIVYTKLDFHNLKNTFPTVSSNLFLRFKNIIILCICINNSNRFDYQNMDKKSSVTVYFEFSFFTLYIDLYRPLHACTITPITHYTLHMLPIPLLLLIHTIHTSLKHFPNTSLSTTRSKCKTWQYERVVAKLNRAGGGTGADRFGCVRSRSLWTVGAVCQLLKY